MEEFKHQEPNKIKFVSTMTALPTDQLVGLAIKGLVQQDSKRKEMIEQYHDLSRDRAEVVLFFDKSEFPERLKEFQDRMKYMPVQFSVSEVSCMHISLQFGTDIINYRLNDGSLPDIKIGQLK